MLIEPAVRAVYYDTQVVIGDCPHAHEIAPLLATVGAAIVAQGVSRIGDALKAAGNAETQTALARRNVEFDTSGTLPKCVAISRVWFYRPVPDHPTRSETRRLGQGCVRS